MHKIADAAGYILVGQSGTR